MSISNDCSISFAGSPPVHPDGMPVTPVSSARARHRPHRTTGGTPPLSATGLSADPKEYRTRLEEQSDEQIDSWAVELLRDISIRKGVLPVLEEFRHACRLDDTGIQRVFSAGGGAPATVGRTADGRIMVPAISLRYLVPGLHAETPDARARLIEYLVASFDELVYI